MHRRRPASFGGARQPGLGRPVQRDPDNHGQPSARGARVLRARISEDPDSALLRQHLANSVVHRHGAIGTAQEAQGPGHRRQARRRRMSRTNVHAR